MQGRRWLQGVAFWIWVGLAGLYAAAALTVVWIDLAGGGRHPPVATAEPGPVAVVAAPGNSAP